MTKIPKVRILFIDFFDKDLNPITRSAKSILSRTFRSESDILFFVYDYLESHSSTKKVTFFTSLNSKIDVTKTYYRFEDKFEYEN